MTMDTTRLPAGSFPRQYPRVAGPFEGVRVSTVRIPILVHNLSVGGCFVEALYDQSPGRRLTIEVEVPFAGLLTLEGETIFSRTDFGYGLRFVDVPPDTRDRLRTAVERLAAGEEHK
jgi:hypothetical protein